jgi:hypothetical protein
MGWKLTCRRVGTRQRGPHPLAARGPVELRLVFASGQEIVVSAESMELEFIGEASYVEEFNGAMPTVPQAYERHNNTIIIGVGSQALDDA